MEINKENLFSVSLQKISILPMKGNSSITPPLWNFQSLKEAERGGGGLSGYGYFLGVHTVVYLFNYLFLQTAACEPVDSNLWCRDK